MGGVDAAVSRVGIDGDADMGVGRIHDVCPMALAVHEGTRQRGHRLASTDVFANFGPAAGSAANDVASVGEKAACCHT